VLTAMIALPMHLFVRRVGGGLQMIRGVFGTLILFAGIIALGRALPSWTEIPPGLAPADMMDAYLQLVPISHVLWAAGVLLVGTIVFLWPARRHPRTVEIYKESSNPGQATGSGAGDAGANKTLA
jgi:hypothetical protein